MNNERNNAERRTLSRREFFAEGVAAVAALALNACSDSSGDNEPAPKPTETLVPTDQAELLICPPYVYTVHDNETAADIAEAKFPDQPIETTLSRMQIVGNETIPVTEAQPGDQIRYDDPDCL